MGSSDQQLGGKPTFEADYREYADARTIQQYRWSTAGTGINYLLPTTYGPIFLENARAALAESHAAAIRALEFGCGAGMALHYLTEKLGEESLDVDLAVGTDFVPAMVATATADMQQNASSWASERIRFVVASNETLVDQIAEGLGESRDSLTGTFQLAIGVNTFRYSTRHDTSASVVAQLHDLLSPGGRVVVIDMNDRFPYGLKPKRRPSGNGKAPLRLGTEPLPSLDEYARPFAEGGFEVLRRENFCWIPHSASGARFRVAKAFAPLLDRLAPGHAMRSLVVARKR